MKICRSKTVRLPIAKCNRENPIVPLIVKSCHIKIPVNWIEVEIIVSKSPNAIFAQTDNKRVNILSVICVKLI